MIERLIHRFLNAFLLTFPIAAAVKTENLVYLLTIIPIAAAVVIIDGATPKK